MMRDETLPSCNAPEARSPCGIERTERTNAGERNEPRPLRQPHHKLEHSLCYRDFAIASGMLYPSLQTYAATLSALTIIYPSVCGLRFLGVWPDGI